jgi:hypothetical protein
LSDDLKYFSTEEIKEMFNDWYWKNNGNRRSKERSR